MNLEIMLTANINFGLVAQIYNKLPNKLLWTEACIMFSYDLLVNFSFTTSGLWIGLHLSILNFLKISKAYFFSEMKMSSLD